MSQANGCTDEVHGRYKDATGLMFVRTWIHSDTKEACDFASNPFRIKIEALGAGFGRDGAQQSELGRAYEGLT